MNRDNSTTVIDAFTWSFIDTVRRITTNSWLMETQSETASRNFSIIPALEELELITNLTANQREICDIWTCSHISMLMMKMEEFNVDEVRIKNTLAKNPLAFDMKRILVGEAIDVAKVIAVCDEFPELLMSYGTIIAACADRQLERCSPETAILEFRITARGERRGRGTRDTFMTFVPHPKLSLLIGGSDSLT